jgi:uncharacterized protein (DUF305 family)
MKRTYRCFAGCLLLGLFASDALAGASAGTTADPHEQSFMAENGCAMTKMMNGMNVKPAGDIDRDFVAMMQPHHQGAIEMAEAELRYGHNEQLRRIAQEIIVDQQQEIVAMRAALGQPLPPPQAAPTQTTQAPSTLAMPMCMAKPH